MFGAIMRELYELLLYDQLYRTRQYRAGYGGFRQGISSAGWPQLGHAGAIEGIVIADYAANPQYMTQAGRAQALAQLTHVSYPSR